MTSPWLNDVTALTSSTPPMEVTSLTSRTRSIETPVTSSFIDFTSSALVGVGDSQRIRRRAIVPLHAQSLIIHTYSWQFSRPNVSRSAARPFSMKIDLLSGTLEQYCWLHESWHIQATHLFPTRDLGNASHSLKSFLVVFGLKVNYMHTLENKYFQINEILSICAWCREKWNLEQAFWNRLLFFSKSRCRKISEVNKFLIWIEIWSVFREEIAASPQSTSYYYSMSAEGRLTSTALNPHELLCNGPVVVIALHVDVLCLR